ncbi:MAG: glycosyltransferase family 2 protein [Pirellulales bacterium]|nr:glycosyltransferase family 2 protein [Pirellulales bacterium]
MSDTLANPALDSVDRPTTSRTPVLATTGLSVIVPLFNEEECASLVVESLSRLEQSLAGKRQLEFLLVDDGSADDTVSLLEQAIGERSNFVILRHVQNRGIAAAICTGLAAASYEVVASIDCDGSYDVGELEEMTEMLVPGVDLVTASPYHPQGSVDNVPEWRLRLSRLASRLYATAIGRPLTCYTCCFRVYRRSAVVNLPLANPGFVGVAELLCRLLQEGGSVVEHPARLQARVAGHSKMRVARAALGHLRLIRQLAFRRFLRRAPPAID